MSEVVAIPVVRKPRRGRRRRVIGTLAAQVVNLEAFRYERERELYERRCATCNTRKWAFDPIEFAQREGRLL